MILTKLHACLRMKIQSIKLYHRKEHPNHHKVFPASMLQWLQGIQKTTVVRRNLNLQALDSRCLSSCCLASWQQMLLPGLETFRHPIDTSSLAQRRILQDTTVCRNLLGCTELLKMQASIHGHYLYPLHFCLFLAHLLFCLFLPGNLL